VPVTARRHTGGSTSGSPTADAAATRATELGGSVVTGPEDAGPFREAVLADPAGATFSVSQLTAGP
jgi:predicted enzyme related to lactoylglutathione lyase